MAYMVLMGPKMNFHMSGQYRFLFWSILLNIRKKKTPTKHLRKYANPQHKLFFLHFPPCLWWINDWMLDCWSCSNVMFHMHVTLETNIRTEITLSFSVINPVMSLKKNWAELNIWAHLTELQMSGGHWHTECWKRHMNKHWLWSLQVHGRAPG